MCEYDRMGEPTLASVPAPPPEPTATPPKAGFRTSEFWLKVAAFVLTTLLASGAIPTNSATAQWIAMVSTMIGSMVYTASRTSIKNTEGA